MQKSKSSLQVAIVSSSLTLCKLLYPREAQGKTNFTTETLMLLRDLDSSKQSREYPVGSFYYASAISYISTGPDPSDGNCPQEVVSQVNAINHVLLIREHD